MHLAPGDRLVIATFAACFGVSSLVQPVSAANPTSSSVISGPDNPVPACATPGRLMAFLDARNAEAKAKFTGIATEYMRHGERLGLRWDWVFFQMLHETGNLAFDEAARTPGVDPNQHNFAGIGAHASKSGGESFASVGDGARAHLEHFSLYAGLTVDDPIAERTRKVQAWGILSRGRRGSKNAKRSNGFADVASRWADSDKAYVAAIAKIAAEFYATTCKAADPQPGLVAIARGEKTADQIAAEEQRAIANGRGTGVEIAKRAIEEERPSAVRAGVGAALSIPYKLLNPLREEQPPAEEPAAGRPSKSEQPDAKRAEKPAVKGNCRVWTASYGGQKAIIVRVANKAGTEFTVLDVNEGREKQEAEAFIAAYAKGGVIAGEFSNQSAALDRAFEHCPGG